MTRTRNVRLLLVFALWAAIEAGGAALGVVHGLNAEYFENGRLAGRPRLARVDVDVSTVRVTANWLDDPPPAFSVRWFGYLTVPQAGAYTFALRSDDGSRLTIDGNLVVDNGGRHSATTRTGAAQLTEGPHFVLIEYVNEVGDYDIEWLWGGADGALRPVPAWLLSPTRVTYSKLAAARAFEWLSLALATAMLALAGWTFGREAWSSLTTQVSRRPRLACLALFVLFAILETWPLAAHPARLSRNDNGDTKLNEWVLAWVAHQAPRAPLDLFEANIFYPERHTLAYSEAMIVQSALAAPLLWLDASPVLAYNVVLIAGFALTGWAIACAVALWSEDWVAGIVAGIVGVFNAHAFGRMPHLQAQHVEFLPFALIALDRLLTSPGIGAAVQLAVLFVLQALASVHLLVFTTVAMVAGAVSRPSAWVGPRFRVVAPYVALAAVIAGAALAPYLLPYWHVAYEQGLSRPLRDAGTSAATLWDYLSSTSRIHYPLWSHRWFSGAALFPGAVALAFALVAIVRGVAFRDPRARMCAAFTVCGLALSLGTKLPTYAFLYRFVPIFQAVRDVSRFGYLVTLGVAMLAGYGVAALRRAAGARWRWPATAALVALALVDPLVAPIHYFRFEGIPSIYDRLRAVPHAVVVEMPFWGPNAAFLQSDYDLNSTRHWQPMVNGYSGFQPVSFRRNAEAYAAFPDARSMAALRGAGITHVFVHLDLYAHGMTEQLARTAGLRLVAAEDAIALYEVDASADGIQRSR